MTVRFEWDESKDRTNIVKCIRSEKRVSVRSSASFQPGKRHLRKGNYMKKATDKPGRTITRTIEQIENRRITKAQRERLKQLPASPPHRIHPHDIPTATNPPGHHRTPQ